MAKTAKFLLGVLSVGALVATGLGAWVINGTYTPTTDDITPEVVTETSYRSFNIVATRDDSSETFVFDAPVEMGGNEHLSIDYTVKAEGVGGFEPYGFDWSKVATQYQPTLKVELKAYEGETELSSTDPFFDYVKLPKAQTFTYTDWLTEEYKETGKPVTVSVDWSDKLGDNPQVVWDKLTREEQETNFAALEEALSGVTFKAIFSASNEEITPVEEVTGDVKLEPTDEVALANSYLEVANTNEDGKILAGEQDITLSVADGYVLSGDLNVTIDGNSTNTIKLRKVEPSQAKNPELTYSNVYTGTYKFEANKTYTFDWKVAEDVPPVVEVESITLNKTELTLDIGGSETLNATVLPDTATDKTVTWESSNKEVATVEDGVVTAVGAGQAIITAKAGEQTATCVVTVNEPATVEYLTIDQVKETANDGDWVTVKGEVVATIGNSAYIADNTNGLYIYNFLDLKPNWTIGKEYLIHGQVDVYNGLFQVSGFKTTGSDEISITELDDDTITPMTPIEIDEEGFKALKDSDAGKMYTFTAEYVSGTPSQGSAISTKWKIGNTDVILRTDGNDKNEITTELEKGALYKVTTPLSWYKGAQFSFLGDGTKLEKIEITLESIELTATATEINVGDTTRLNAELLPTGATGDVVYEITEGNEFATLEGNVLTGTAEGTVKVVAKVGDITSNVVTITINPAPTDEKEAVYSFSKMEVLNGDTWKGTAALSISEAIEVLNNGAQSEEDKVISSVTTATNVYNDSNFEKSPVKFSTGSRGGVLTFETTVDVTEITIEAIVWGSDSAFYNVLDANSSVAGTHTFESAGLETETFNFTEPTHTITIEAGTNDGCRFAICGLTFTYTAE